MSDLYTPEELEQERAKARLPVVHQLIAHIDVRERQLAIAVAGLEAIVHDDYIVQSCQNRARKLLNDIAQESKHGD